MNAFVYIIDIVLGVSATVSILNTLSSWRYTWGLPISEVPASTPPVAVIVAIKNASGLACAFIGRLRRQDYPDYRIIAAVESEDDSAFAMLEEESQRPGPPLQIVVAGQSERTGQKVWNLLAALGAIEDRDEIVAFIDADTLPTPEWLPRLAAALVNTGREAVSGYRWIIPADNRVSSACVAAANASIVTLGRVPFIVNHCWGGTTAMRRKTLERIAIRRYWAGAISDDARMTRALRDSGIAVYSPRQSLLLSPAAMSWSEALSFGQRQYRLVWLHNPGLWTLAAFATILPVVAAIAAVAMALQGSLFAGAYIVASLSLGEVRYSCRRKIAAALWREEADANRAVYWRVERWLRPLWWSFHALCVVSALGSRRIRWAGVDYFVRGAQDVEVSRPPPARS